MIGSVVVLFDVRVELVAVVIVDLEVEGESVLRKVLSCVSIVVLVTPEQLTFPIAPIPTIPNVNPVGSRLGTRPFFHPPSLAPFSALYISLNTARIRNIAISAVASATASMVLQNQMPSCVIQSTSNSLKPAEADVMILQCGTSGLRRSSSNGSYGGVPILMRKASMGPDSAIISGRRSFVSCRFVASRTCSDKSQHQSLNSPEGAVTAKSKSFLKSSIY